jgi:hypothetical protein
MMKCKKSHLTWAILMVSCLTDFSVSVEEKEIADVDLELSQEFFQYMLEFSESDEFLDPEELVVLDGVAESAAEATMKSTHVEKYDMPQEEKSL